jgi:transcriptional regulator with XRE-family HTH domain
MMELLSTMTDSQTNASTARIAARVRTLRRGRQLSLDRLAATSGVSRSMISLIERAESSPTAVVLERLATALGVTMASMFEAGDTAARSSPVSRRDEQVVWKDPASGYVRRNVSPASARQNVQIVEVHFPARRRVAFESGARTERVSQQVWMLAGEMIITTGPTRHRLRAGDSLAMELSEPTMFYNPTGRPARYAVVLSTEPGIR